MDFTVMAARAQMELEIKRRAVGTDLGGRRPTVTDSQFSKALWLIESGEPATQVARDLGMSRAILCRRVRGLPMPTI